MRYIKLFEEHHSPKVIEFDIEDGEGNVVGNVSGVIHYSETYLQNWMDTNGLYDDSKEAILKNTKLPVAILKNLNVDDEHKNKGYGNQGLEQFLSETEEADYVLLIADGGETNDINLEHWYKRHGFETIGGVIDFPLMLLDRTK